MNRKHETKHKLYAKLRWAKGFSPRLQPEGQVIIIPLIFLTVVMILSVTLFGRVINFINTGSRGNLGEQAFNLADAGVDYAIYALNNSQTCSPNCTLTVGTGEVKITIATAGADRKITSDGCVPNCTSPRKKNTVKVDVVQQTQTINLLYLAQALANGINVGGSSTENQQIIGGDVWTNGNITISGGASPISTIQRHATANSIQAGITVQGGTTIPVPSPKPLPTLSPSDVYWQNKASDLGNTNCNSQCNLSNTTLVGRYYNGDVYVGGTMTVNGPVYIEGSLIINSGCKIIQPNNTLAGKLTTVIVEKKISSGSSSTYCNGLSNNRNQGPIIKRTDTQDASGKYGYLLLYSKSDGSSGNPSAYAQAVLIGGEWITEAVILAPNGIVSLQAASTSAQNDIGAFAANRILMANRDYIYDPNLPNTPLYDPSPSSTWIIKKGTYRQSQ